MNEGIPENAYELIASLFNSKAIPIPIQKKPAACNLFDSIVPNDPSIPLDFNIGKFHLKEQRPLTVL
jgi:hypothetical protein